MVVDIKLWWVAWLESLFAQRSLKDRQFVPLVLMKNSTPDHISMHQHIHRIFSYICGLNWKVGIYIIVACYFHYVCTNVFLCILMKYRFSCKNHIKQDASRITSCENSLLLSTSQTKNKMIYDCDRLYLFYHSTPFVIFHSVFLTWAIFCFWHRPLFVCGYPFFSLLSSHIVCSFSFFTHFVTHCLSS